MKQYLFSYGTLQLEKVQLKTFGRVLKGNEDTLTGYSLKKLKITDQEVLEKSKQQYHPVAVKTDCHKDKIKGIIFEITKEELMASDEYEVSDYERILETFDSDQQAWIYISKR